MIEDEGLPPRPEGFRVAILTGVEPRIVMRLIEEIHRNVPEARVCGVLYHQLRPLNVRERVRALRKNLRDPSYVSFVVARAVVGVRGVLYRLSRAGLGFLHAYLPRDDMHRVGLDHLADRCRELGCPLLVTANVHAPKSLAFVRGLDPDLAVVYGTPILKPKLFTIPRLGSINIHQRKVPDYRGGGPIGLWEMLDGQPEIGVTVHRVAKELDAGAVVRASTIPIQPFSTLESLALHAHAVGIDLIARAVGDFARDEVRDVPQTGPSRVFRSPKPPEMRRYEKKIAAGRPPFVPARTRLPWNLLARSLLFAPVVAVRNWYRRLTGSFPVVVLYHHLVSDRPHPMGIPTGYFLKHLAFLHRYYRVVDLPTARAMLKSGRVTAPTVVLTFDDGYKDTHQTLRAAALETDSPATLFVCSQRVETQQPFDHDLGWGVEGFLPLTWDQLRDLEAYGYEIGSHSRTHFDCGSADRDRLSDEVVDSKAEIEMNLGHPIETFSFPYGLQKNISRPAMELAEATYPCVSSAYGGANYPGQAGAGTHLFRWSHPNSLWELELLLQSILELRQPPLWTGG